MKAGTGILFLMLVVLIAACCCTGLGRGGNITVPSPVVDSSGIPVGNGNYVFFDMDSEQFHALLPNNEYAILNKIGLPVSGNVETPLSMWLYYVVKADTNQDKQLSGQDKFTVSMSDIRGNNYVELIPDVDEALGQFMKSDTVLLFFYRQGNKKYYAKIDLQSGSVVATTEYPSFGVDVK